MAISAHVDDDVIGQADSVGETAGEAHEVRARVDAGHLAVVSVGSEASGPDERLPAGSQLVSAQPAQGPTPPSRSGVMWMT